MFHFRDPGAAVAAGLDMIDAHEASAEHFLPRWQDERQVSALVNSEDLGQLARLVEVGKVRPIIDRTVPFVEVPEAITYVEQRHTRGKVVIEAGLAPGAWSRNGGNGSVRLDMRDPRPAKHSRAAACMKRHDET